MLAEAGQSAEMPWSAQVEEAVRADDVDQVRALLAQGHKTSGCAENGDTLWSIATEWSSSAYRILCGFKPEQAAIFKHAAYLPDDSDYLLRANPNHRAGLALLLRPSLLRLLNLWLTRRGAWGESALYAVDPSMCATLLAFFLPQDALERLDARLKGIDPSRIAIAIGDGALDLVVISHDPRASGTLHSGLHRLATDAGDGVPEAVALLGVAMERADAALQMTTRPLEGAVRCLSAVPLETRRDRHAWRCACVWTILREAPLLSGALASESLGAASAKRELVPVVLERGVRVITLSDCIPPEWARAVSSNERRDTLLLAPGQVTAMGDDGCIRVTPGGHGAGFRMHADAHEKLPVRTSMGR